MFLILKFSSLTITTYKLAANTPQKIVLIHTYPNKEILFWSLLLGMSINIFLPLYVQKL